MGDFLSPSKKEGKKETKKETISAHLTKVVQLRIGTIHANLAIAGCVSGSSVSACYFQQSLENDEQF